jgi:hypothetical protein
MRGLAAVNSQSGRVTRTGAAAKGKFKGARLKGEAAATEATEKARDSAPFLRPGTQNDGVVVGLIKRQGLTTSRSWATMTVPL